MAGEMSPDWYAYVQRLVNSKVPNAGNCNVCGGVNTVNLSPHLVTPVVTSPHGGVQLAAQQYPQAMLLCGKCGHTTYFNYVVMAGNSSNG